MTDKKLPATLEERAREAVNAALGTIYTDEELDALVRAEVDRFFTKPTEKFAVCSKRRRDSNWNSSTTEYWSEYTEAQLSPFQLLVWNMCASLVLNRIVETSQDEKLGIITTFQAVTDDHGNVGPSVQVNQLGEEIQKRAEQLAKDNMHLMFVQMFSNMMQMGKEDMMADFARRFGMPGY